MLKLTSKWQHCYSGVIYINFLRTRFRLKITFCYASNFNIKFDSRQENCITPFFHTNQPFCSIPSFFVCLSVSFFFFSSLISFFRLFSSFQFLRFLSLSLQVSSVFSFNFLHHVVTEERKQDKKNTEYFTHNVLIIFQLFVFYLRYQL